MNKQYLRRALFAMCILIFGYIAGVYTILQGMTADHGAVKLAEFKQPENINYNKDKRGYTVVISDLGQDKTGWPFQFGPLKGRYEMRIVRDDAKPELRYMDSYNKPLGLSVANLNKSDEYIQSFKINWLISGVELIEPNGVKNFFPKEVFVDGN
jgi:hypothetical protein